MPQSRAQAAALSASSRSFPPLIVATDRPLLAACTAATYGRARFGRQATTSALLARSNLDSRSRHVSPNDEARAGTLKGRTASERKPEHPTACVSLGQSRCGGQNSVHSAGSSRFADGTER